MVCGGCEIRSFCQVPIFREWALLRRSIDYSPLNIDTSAKKVFATIDYMACPGGRQVSQTPISRFTPRKLSVISLHPWSAGPVSPVGVLLGSLVHWTSLVRVQKQVAAGFHCCTFSIEAELFR
jgi:hypothetical protein